MGNHWQNTRLKFQKALKFQKTKSNFYFEIFDLFFQILKQFKLQFSLPNLQISTNPKPRI